MKKNSEMKQMVDLYRQALKVLALLEQLPLEEGDLKAELQETENEIIEMYLKYFKANHIYPKDVK